MRKNLYKLIIKLPKKYALNSQIFRRYKTLNMMTSNGVKAVLKVYRNAWKYQRKKITKIK